MAGVFLDSGVREVTLPPEGEEPPEQPTEGHFGVPPTPRAPGSWEPPPSGDDGESGASASSHPNE
jgi:hypothetical protein